MIKNKKLLFLLFSAFFTLGICTAQSNADIKFVTELQNILGTKGLEAGIEFFKTMPKELNENIDIKSIQGALYYSNQDFNNAIKTANEILEIQPDNQDALELLYKCYKAKNDYHSYSEIEKKLLAMNPNNPFINIQKAEENVINKKWKLARTYYKKALTGDPKNPDALFGYGKTSYYLDDLPTAEKFFKKVLEIDPSYSEALAYLGKLDYEKENYDEAVKYVKEALKNDPWNYSYWLDLGNYYRYQGKYQLATQAWEKAAEINSDYFLTYAYLAGIYDEQNNYEKALENYHKVIKTNPDYFYAYEAIAILEYHEKNYEEAGKYFLKAYEYNDSYSYTLMAYACYSKIGKSFEGKKLLDKQLKKLNNKSTEYDLVRFFKDPYSRNAETSLLRKINAEENNNTRCKMLFYMGLYNEINEKGSEVLAKEFYAQATDINAPMFFEYRIAEWGLEK